jgi:hypothetical protein
VSRTKPLTIIGGRPSETYGPLANDNGFLDKITVRLAKFAPKRAASVVDIAELLDAETKSEVPLSVQIIGHAISGQLLLGAPYIGDEDKHRAWPYFVIDTTPSSLGFLSRHAGKLDELLLVGCNVGTSLSDWPVNGRSLLYCLSETLRCRVAGAITTVSLEAFDDCGRYCGPRACWSWSEPGPPTFSVVGV